MSNSKLVNCTRISPNSSNPRNDKIKKITIHHMAGDLSVETCGKVFAPKSRRASSNYGVDSNGRVGMYVEEKNRSWCSSSASNDNQAITIEVANNSGAPNWTVSDIALTKTIELCVDICKRNDIKKLNFTGDTSGNLTMHKWFTATACPGPYLESKFQYIADKVNKLLSHEEPPKDEILHKVQSGESWWEITQEAWGDGNRYMELVKYNGFDSAPVIHPGDIVRIPCDEKTPAPPKTAKTSEEIAKEVIRGDWGNGSERKTALEKAGYDYSKVQNLVNKMLK